MSVFGIITFHEVDLAEKTYDKLKSLQKEKQIDIEDAIIVTEDSEGKIKIKETADATSKRGALAGGGIGLVIGLVVGGPIGGALLGGAAGAFIGKKVDLGIPKEKIEEAIESMDKASSSLLLQINEEHTKIDLLRAAIKQSGGEIIEVEVSGEATVDLEETLNSFTGGSSN